MGRSEEWFWNTTPKLLITMIETEKKIEVERLKTLATYTACYVRGKDPEEHEEEVQGVESPASEKAVSQFY